jgi:hypothetical protein
MNQIFSPNLDLTVSCPSNDPDHASDGIRAPGIHLPSRETVGRSIEIGALRRWFADLQLGKAFGGRKSAFAIVVQDEAVISR